MRSRIYGLTFLAAMYAMVLGLAGCPSSTNPPGGVTATQPSATASAQTYATLAEVRKAYGFAEDEAVRLHQGKFISDATLVKCRDYLRIARRAIDGAESLLTTHPFDPLKFASSLTAAWQAIDDAVAVHSPGISKPSAARTK